MTTVLAIHSYPGANKTLQLHWPYFFNVDADVVVIGTEDGDTWCPEENELLKIGMDKYIDGNHLPFRLVETFRKLSEDYDTICVVEYDTVIFKPIQVENMKHGAAAFLTGYIGNAAFHHNPWILKHKTARQFYLSGTALLATGICEGTAAASPDVFFGMVMNLMGEPVQNDLWTQFTRNSLDVPGDLDLARAAFRSGVDIIHGIKTKAELDYILS